jgi:hypothetical protein
MKTLFTLCFAVFVSCAVAQTRDLMALAQGEFLGMNALFDEKENLFGYISVYDYGKVGDKTKKFEYVVLDKNLNPVANNTFEGDITAGNYTGYMNFEGKIVLRPSELDASLISKKELFTPSPMLIDLKENTVQKKVFYDFDHGTFSEILQHDTWKANRKENRTEKRKNGFNYVSAVAEIKEGGFLVFDGDDYGTYEKNSRIMRYDENKKELWSYEYNKNGSRSESQTMSFLEKDEQYFYGLMREQAKKEKEKYSLVVIDMKTGQEIHKKQIPGSADILSRITEFPTFSYGMLDNDRSFDDKIVLLGRLYNDYGAGTGLARLVIDRKTFATELKTLGYKKDFRKFIPKINDLGFVELGYFLDPRDIFFLKDGSIGILFEKYKPASQYTAQKTTDMVYVFTDKDFNIVGARVFEKEKSIMQNSDYLFSQNLNNGNDLVFFYRDYQKDEETRAKNWNLFINTLINGTFKQEVIPISSKKNFLIIPYVAKEGYIMLHEFNKKAKYNQIRLERLNY